MQLKKVLSIAARFIAVISTLALAACATTQSSYESNVYTAKMQSGITTTVAFESFTTQATFPSGETASLLFVRQVNPSTGTQLKGGPSDWDVRYAFNGESLGRVIIHGLTSAIIPSLINGAVGIKIADMKDGTSTGTMIYNLNSAGVSSDTNVGVTITN